MSVDINSTIAQRTAAPQGSMGKLKRAMKTSSAVGDVEFTECAALVFPKLDELAVATGDEAQGKREKLKHYKNFSETYFDRRAQAKHVSSNPNTFRPSCLALPFSLQQSRWLSLFPITR